MSALTVDIDEEPKVVSFQGRDSQFIEVFDIKTGMRIETKGNEEPKDTEKEKAILRRQSIVVMQEATNYAGYNVSIKKGKVKLSNETKYLRKILMDKKKLHEEMYQEEFS